MTTISSTLTTKAPRKVRYAVVGLGHIAQHAVLPGLAQAKRSSLVTALVSDDREKLEQVGGKYQVANRYSYDQYEECLHSGEIDAVYIALPNEMHADYAIRAAKAGIHVLCEKPMAVSERQGREMIAAAREHNVRLMIAYRLHFERANLAAIDTSTGGELGDLRYFASTFGMQLAPGDIRSRPLAIGGGTLYDLGIYCINAARYLFRAEPVEVFALSARNGDPRFAEIDEMTAATLRFPGERLATFVSSFGSAATATYDLVGTKGRLRIDNCYEYEGEMTQTLTIDGKSEHKTHKRSDQFAGEIDYFSDCILDGLDPEPGGEEGLADVRIIEALYQSARIGRPVPIGRLSERQARPDSSQERSFPPVRPPRLVKARPASLS